MIRQMDFSDLEAVIRVEKAGFAESWPISLLKQGIDCPLDFFFVLEEDSNILGYAVLRLIGDEAELQRITVLPEYRQAGRAGKLMDALVDFARDQKAAVIFLEVRNGNKAAKKLYRSKGFVKKAVRKGYYRNPKEDADIMCLELI